MEVTHDDLKKFVVGDKYMVEGRALEVSYLNKEADPNREAGDHTSEVVWQVDFTGGRNIRVGDPIRCLRVPVKIEK